MARFVTGNSFSTGNQVTAATLNAAVNNATISADSVDNSSVAVSGSGVLSVKTSTGESDGITFGKMQHIPANTVLVRDANDVGVVSAKAVTDTQILIGDGTGFTAAALSGDVTMTNAGAVTIANDAVETAMIADDVALGGNPTTTTQSASNNSTRIATTAYVDAQVNLVPTPAIVTTFTARNGEEQRYFKNLSEVTDPNSIISINSGQEIQFASTGTYLVKAGVNIDDNDSDTGDEYNAVLVPTHGSTTPITFGGAPMRSMEIRAGANTGVCTTFTFAYVVSNTTNDRLAIYAEPISSASAIQWEGAAVIEITKIA